MNQRHKLTPDERRRGGLTTARRTPPDKCPKCRRHSFASWSHYAGHLGLHAYADKFTGGDLKAAAKSLNLVGIAATDPYPQNGAFARAHNEAARVRSIADSELPF